MSILTQPLKINGVVSTDKTVLQNLNELCSAAGAFLSFDISQGKWAVIINRAGNSVASFDDSNIVGAINISETGVSELYNSSSFEFPHRTLRDQTDYVGISIPTEDRYPNEIDNVLNIQSSVINDPVQAQYIAAVELRQSRLSKVITFSSDFSNLGIKAGDLINVTSTMYGFSTKAFRVIKIDESDLDGVIGVNITALEYSEDIYDTTGFVSNQRTKKTGIMLKEQNSEIERLEDVDAASQITRLLVGNVALGLVNNLLNKLFTKEKKNGKATGKIVPKDKAAEDLDKVLAGAKRPELDPIQGPDSICEGGSVTLTIGHSCTSCLFDIPDFDYPYTITGVSSNDISVPLTGNVTVSGGVGTLTFTVNTDTNVEGTETLVFTCGGLTKSIAIHDRLSFTYTTVASPTSITEGSLSTVTVTTTGLANGTTIPYTISDNAGGRITTALSGTVTVSGNSASLIINTNDDSTYTGVDSTVTITFNPGQSDPCEQLDKTATLTIVDNDTAPPPTTTCEFVSVPVVWCAIYDGTDNQLTDVSVAASVMLPKALNGEPSVSVPLTLSVTKGNPSSIGVATNVSVASSSSLGGFPVKIITSFNTVAPKGLITGTTTTLTGY